MKYLLDTHTLLWLDSEPEKLSNQAYDTLADSDNELLVSLASIWEIQIKWQLGKLTLRLSLEEMINEQQRINGIMLMSMTLGHILQLEALPQHHRDPFDRMIISQAMVEGLPIITADSQISKYPVQVIW